MLHDNMLLFPRYWTEKDDCLHDATQPYAAVVDAAGKPGGMQLFLLEPISTHAVSEVYNSLAWNTNYGSS